MLTSFSNAHIFQDTGYDSLAHNICDATSFIKYNKESELFLQEVLTF